MRSLLGALSLTALLGLVQAQKACNSITSQIPACAASCIKTAASSVGCTVATDYACQCANAAAIQNAAVDCVIGCGFSDVQPALNGASSLCSCKSHQATKSRSLQTSEKDVLNFSAQVTHLTSRQRPSPV